MKNYIILIALFCLSFQPLVAQDNGDSTSTLRFGALGGVNFSQWSGDVSTPNNFRAGFHIGAIVQTNIAEVVHLQLEPQYSLEGYSFGGGGGVRANFINIPALARLFSTGDLSLEAGPKLKIRASEKAENQDGDVRKTNRVKTVWFGIVAGASYTIADNLAAQFRFSYTPSDIIKANAGDTEGTSGILLQFGLAYMFN